MILAVALVGGVIFAIRLIGSAALTVLATLLIGGLVLAGVIAVSALPIRAWRKNDAAAYREAGHSRSAHPGQPARADTATAARRNKRPSACFPNC